MDVADRVIRGDYGNGDARRANLAREGYSYASVQNEVNRRLGYSKRYWLYLKKLFSEPFKMILIYLNIII